MKRILTICALCSLSVIAVRAGNPDRRGEAGAPELLMNGYARSAGLWGLNVANVRGLEAEGNNPAGLAKTTNMEVIFSYNSWLTNSGITLIKGGIVKKIKTNAFALTVQALNTGTIDRTTENNPGSTTGNNLSLGTLKPTFLNIGVSYAKNFSLGSNKITGDNVITGGLNLRLVNETVDQVSATGIGFDLGLQYTTGKKENLHIGLSLRNVGTPLKFTGDGLNFTSTAETGGFTRTAERKTNKLELPTQLNMGVAYDILMGPKIEVTPNKFKQNYRLTFMGQYSANAFGFDNYGLGAEFSMREIFMLRAAYRMENSIWSADRKTAYNGVAAGMSFNVPFKKDGPSIGLDYGIRLTGGNTPFDHTHTVGLRFNLGGAGDKQREDELSAKEKTALDAPVEVVTPREAKRAGKKGKVSIEDLEARDAQIDSLNKLTQELKIKAATPMLKIDTVTVVKTETIYKTDTILVPTTYEKSDYKGGDIDTVTTGGKKTLKFNDYDVLQFETGSDKIQAKSYAYMNYLINILKKNPSYHLQLDGHTDNVGDRDANVKLSQSRVNAVRSYFESKGVNGNRILTNAYGPDKPKYKNDSAAGRAKNRRVEVFMEM
jgi:outer membrane protein OmpA-like peptidoglycan-associated protein